MNKKSLFIVAILAVAAFFFFRVKKQSESAGVNGSGFAPGGGGGGGGSSTLGGGRNSAGVTPAAQSANGGQGFNTGNLVNLFNSIKSLFGNQSADSAAAWQPPTLGAWQADSSPLSLSNFAPNPAADFGNYGLNYDNFGTFFGASKDSFSPTFFQDSYSLFNPSPADVSFAADFAPTPGFADSNSGSFDTGFSL